MTKTAHIAKSRLLSGCAGAALLSALVFAPQQAEAQAYNATPTFNPAEVTIDRSQPNVDTIRMIADSTVIDWTPFIDNNGNDATFLPNGNTAIYLGQNGAAGFSVLNRIIPTQNFSPAVFEGLVQAFLTDANGGIVGPGGFVAFSSPAGIIVGSTGRFEVPQLMLTSLDVDLLQFPGFTSGGSLTLFGSGGPINIGAGAQMVGAPEDSFLVVVAPNITMAGNAYFNGSIAYVAGQQVQLAHSSGLFDIFVPLGPAGGQVITHSGSSGGPSSTGAPGDEHVIYGVTAGAFGGSPVSMLFSGNLGFDPAASASIVNGDIILSANYEVQGRTVDGDSNRAGRTSYFDGRTPTSGVQADIILTDLNASSNLLAIGTHSTQLNIFGTVANFDGDVTLVGRQEAFVNALDGASINIAGDLFVSARNFGNVTQGPLGIDAFGGDAAVFAESSSINVVGQTMVTADAVAGLDFINGAVGSGTAGSALIQSIDGTINFGGSIYVDAIAQTDQVGIFPIMGEQIGGSAEINADGGGSISTLSAVLMDASARAGNQDGSSFAADGPADATGGSIFFGTGPAGGAISIASLFANADGIAGTSIAGGVGMTGEGGVINIDSLGGGNVQITGGKSFSSVDLTANGYGGNEDGGGDGGTGIGGQINWTIDGSTLSVVQTAIGEALGVGGTGTNGGLGMDNSVSLSVLNGSNVQFDNLFLESSAVGGDAIDGNAGSGIAGSATLTVIDSTLSAGFLNLQSFGQSGIGLVGGIGQGGDVTATIDNSIVTFTSGFAATSYGAGQNAVGNLEGGSGIGSDAVLILRNNSVLTAPGAFGGVSVGSFGEGANTVDADAGDGTGGLAQFDADTGSTANISQLYVGSFGLGGTSTNGLGGDGQGVSATMNVTGGAAVSATSNFTLESGAFGGNGTSGGMANADDVTLTIAPLSSLAAGTAQVSSSATGGNGTAGAGGAADGGLVQVTLQGTLSIGTSGQFVATADGGNGTGGNGGLATGGNVLFGHSGGFLDAGAASITFDTSGNGGDALAAGGLGGDGIAGNAIFITQLGGQSQLGSLQMFANGVGGNSVDLLGGLGQAGFAGFGVSGSGTSLVTASGINLLADGTGGDSASGDGGDGIGGAVAASVQNLADVSAGGGLNLSANATGGAAPGGAGGAASGGTVSIGSTPTGGTLTISDFSQISVDAFAGQGFAIAGETGATATGGTVEIIADDGAQLSFAGIDISADASGSDITGAGTGGTAQGGTVQLTATLSTIDASDGWFITANSIGGDGGTGGSAIGGSIDVSVLDAQLTFVGDFSAATNANGGTGSITGGDVQGGDFSFVLSGPDGRFTAGEMLLVSRATGGTGGSDNGGDAIGGSIAALVDEGAVLDVNAIAALQSIAMGGPSFTAGFGTSTAGDSALLVRNGAGVLVGSVLRVESTGQFGGNSSLIIETAGVNVGSFIVAADGRGATSANVDGTDGIGGTAEVIVRSGQLTATDNNNFVRANGVGGDSSVGSGGSGIAGTARFFNIGGTVSMANSSLIVEANSNGGTALSSGQQAGSAFAGVSILETSGGGSTTVRTPNVRAQAIGGSGPDAIGGAGTGGSATIRTTGAGSVLIAGASPAIQSFGQGGDSTTPGATGGDGTGGISNFIVESSGSAQVGNLLRLNADGRAGSGASGGDGVGGDVSLILAGGGTHSFGAILLESRGEGGDSPDAGGGDGTGGTALLDVGDGATLDVTGDVELATSALPGSGAAGGSGQGGAADFRVVGSTATIGGDVLMLADASSGFDPTGTGIAGNATGGSVTLLIDGSNFSAPNAFVGLTTDAIAGGSAGTGIGGDATGGTITVDILNGSNANLGNDLTFASLAVSGGSNGGDGGDAVGGDNRLTVDGSTVTVGFLTFETTATGNFGATGGNATGGSNVIELVGATLDATRTTIFGGVVSRGDGATGTGGIADISLADGSLADFGETYLETYAEAVGANATSSSGFTTIGILAGGSPSFATFGDSEIFNDALGGTTNNAGTFAITAPDGGIDFASLLINNLGDVAPLDPPAITALGGTITFADFLTVATTGDLQLAYANGGGIFGGTGPNDLIAPFDITASDTLFIDGDDASARGIAADTMALSSNDIEVSADALFGGNAVTLTSLNTDEQAMLGGATAGGGYSLLEAEAQNILAQSLSIVLPDVVSNDIDAVIGDLALLGSLDSGFSNLDIFVDGAVNVTGGLVVDSSASTDTLVIGARDRVTVTLPNGSIRSVNGTGVGGVLTITAPDILAASDAVIAQIIANPDDSTLPDLLIDDGGASTITDYLVGDRVELVGDNTIFLQNTGADGIFGGILSGPGGLLIMQSSDALSNLMRTIAFGRRLNADGTFTTNDDYFFAAEFNPDREGHFTSDATLNDCIIVTSACPLDISENGPDVNNRTLFEQPLQPGTGFDEGITFDTIFGLDFPSLVDAPLISEEGVIRDPVTSGGDSAVYATVFGAGVDVMDPEEEDCEEDENEACEGEE